MSERVKNLEFSMMPVDGNAILHHDNLLVMDNLDDDQSKANQPGNHFKDRFPMRSLVTNMLIVIKGSMSFRVNFKDYKVESNSCVVISQGTIIEWCQFDDDAKVIFMSIAQNEWPGVTMLQQPQVHRLYAMQVVKLRLEQLHIDMLKTTYRMMRTILEDPLFSVEREQVVFNCLSFMSAIIAQGSANEPEIAHKTSRKDEIVARFLQSVNEHYRQHRELSFYAEQLCLSLKYMSNVVYEQTGRHPSQWIKEFVILDAKSMLRSGQYSVQQVAYELNFPNQSFFGKYFKEAVGVSPKKW